MNFISDLHDYNFSPSEEGKQVVEDFLGSGIRKKLQDFVESVIDAEFDRLESEASDYISRVAASRAQNFLEKVLSGDNDAAMALFGDASSRSRYRQFDDHKPWASFIHGHLFETGGIALRRKIVDAHAEILKTERIKDLESIVAGLGQQIAKLEDDIKRYRMEKIL